MTTLMNLPIEMETSPVQLAAPRLDTDRPLPILCNEMARDRWIGLFVIAIAIGFYAVMTLGFWAPADGGVDQNAYLLGGRMIAEHGTPRYTLPNPYAYVGNMFIRTSGLDVKGGDYYPKYPFGLPLLYASFFWICGATRAASLAFLVSPVCAILAVTGMFFLARLVAGSFAAVMAAILLGTSQLMIELSNNPNSHASCVAFIIWGMYFLLRWWQSGKMWIGILAGFLIGYAGLIRYSEGLLVLPIAMASASRMRWSDWRSYLRNAIPGLTWAIPIGAMLIFNKHTMGNWTGYDSTNESEGFTWLKFRQTWEQMIRTYYDTGAFFVLPFGLAGIGMIFRRSWQLGLVMLLWLLPGTALYTSYYWSPDRGISYARFILTFMPVVMLGAAICFKDGILSSTANARWYRRFPQVLAVGAVVLIASGVGVYRSAHGLQQGSGGSGGGGEMAPLEEQFRVRQSMANIGQELLAHVPVNSVVFADNASGGGGNERPLNYLQFLRHWDVYSSDAFDIGGPRQGVARRINNPGGRRGAATPDPNADPNAVVPTTRQPLQIEYMESLYEHKMGTDLRNELANVINTAGKAGHTTYALVSVARDRDMRIVFNMAGKYKIKSIDTWTDLQPGPPDEIAAEAGSANGRRRGGGAGGGGGGNRRFPGGGATAEATGTTWEILEIKPAT
jgi:Dolichyl-phosphate-mannose-protein mannosyltransferase